MIRKTLKLRSIKMNLLTFCIMLGCSTALIAQEDLTEEPPQNEEPQSDHPLLPLELAEYLGLTLEVGTWSCEATTSIVQDPPDEKRELKCACSCLDADGDILEEGFGIPVYIEKSIPASLPGELITPEQILFTNICGRDNRSADTLLKR